MRTAIRKMVEGQAAVEGELCFKADSAGDIKLDEITDVAHDYFYSAENGKTYRRVKGSNCDKCACWREKARGNVDWRLCGELPECQAVVHGEFVFMVWVEVE